MERNGIDLPLVSILIASKDRPEALERCLRSVLFQTYEKKEILILDDGSQCDLASSLRGKFPAQDIFWMRSDQTLGVAAGRNRLIEKANGDWLIVLDDDAAFADDKSIENFANQSVNHPEAGVFAFKIIDMVEGRPVRYRIPFRQRTVRHDPGVADEAGYVTYFLGGGHAVCAEVFRSCGLYPENFFYGSEEIDLSYRMIERGYRIFYLPRIVVFHYPETSDTMSISKRTCYIYYTVRNRTWVALRYLPWHILFIHLIIWYGIYLVFAFRNGGLKDTLRGMVDGLRGYVGTKRTPLSKEAIAYVRAHRGRLIF